MKLNVVVRGLGQYELSSEPAEPLEAADPAGPVLVGPGGELVPLLDLVLIGHAPDCDLIVKHPDVSAHHAELLRIDQRWYELRDLESAAGTFVGGRRIGTASVGDGDEVRLGGFSLRVRLG